MVLGDPLTVMERVEVLSIIRKVNSPNKFGRFFQCSYRCSSLILDKCCLLLKYVRDTICILAGKIWIKLKLRSLLLCICPCVICNYINVFSCLHLPRIDWCASLPDTIVLWPTEVSWGLYSIPLIEANPRIEISFNILLRSFQRLRRSCICSYLSSITIRRKPSLLKFHSIVNVKVIQ